MRYLSGRPALSQLIYLEAISQGRYLPLIARRWIRPLLEQVLGQIKVGDTTVSWEESLYPLVATAFMHLTFGHFALAPLLAEVFDRDPLEAEWVKSQTDFIRKLIQQMFSPAWDGPTPDA